MLSRHVLVLNFMLILIILLTSTREGRKVALRGKSSGDAKSVAEAVMVH